VEDAGMDEMKLLMDLQENVCEEIDWIQSSG
jgi:hypothetical protein